MAVKMGRDPFARHTVTKQSVRCLNGQECAWCGSRGRQLKLGTQLWRYNVEDDHRKSHIAKGRLFCSISCVNSYTG